MNNAMFLMGGNWFNGVPVRESPYATTSAPKNVHIKTNMGKVLVMHTTIFNEFKNNARFKI